MAMAAVAAGADGLIIEVHPKPEEALSDGPQSLKPDRFAAVMAGVAVSIAIHLVLVAVFVWGKLPASRYDVKRGEPLIVELPKGDDSPPPGRGGVPMPRPAAPAAPSAP